MEKKHSAPISCLSKTSNFFNTAQDELCKQGWSPRANLDKNKLLLRKTVSRDAISKKPFKTILTPPLYGDPTG